MLFTKTRNVKSPTRGTSESAGIDFFIPNDFPETIIYPGGSVNIPSGIKVILEHGTAGIFFNKSGVAVKGLMVGACVVDSDYRGEVHLNIHNVSKDPQTIKPGQKITQMLIMNVGLDETTEIHPDDYNDFGTTERGTGGFGSTGSF